MFKRLIAICCALLILCSTNLTAFAQEVAIKQNNAIYQAVLDADLPQVAGIFPLSENNNWVNTLETGAAVTDYNASWLDLLDNNQLPEGAYTYDATWADNSTVNTEVSPTFEVDNSASEEYVYVPRAERENNIEVSAQQDYSSVQPDQKTTDLGTSWQDRIDAMTPEEKAKWDNYVAIFSANTYYSDLSGYDADFLCEYSFVKAEDLDVLESMGLTLLESLPHAQTALEFGVSATKLFENFPVLSELFNYSAQMTSYLFYLNEQLLGGETDTLLREYLLDGFSCEQVISAYGVSRALDIDISVLLTGAEEQQLPDILSQTSKSNYESLAQDYGIRTDLLAGYAIDNGLGFRDVERLVEVASLYISELYTLESPDTSVMAVGDDETVLAFNEPDAPYSYDYNNTERVNLNSGALVYENIDYTLPGVNGLDLIIGRRYDSDDSNVYTPMGKSRPNYDTPVYNYYVHQKKEMRQWLPGLGWDPWKTIYDVEDNCGSNYSSARAFYNSLLLGEDGPYYTGEYIWDYPVEIWYRYSKGWREEFAGWAYSGTTYSSYTDPNTYFNNTHGLGTGWSFMFSSIQTINDTEYLHLADGRSYEVAITSTAGDSNLKDYTLTDLRLEQESGGYNNGSVSSTHTLYYKDGKKEYFSSDGKLIGIKDRYGNTIKFVNDTLNNQPRITITDTLNRVTTISSSAVSSGARTVTVALPESMSLKYTVSADTSDLTSCYTLTAYADTMDLITDYRYQVSAGGFDVWNKGTAADTNYFMNLKTITHPTGAVSEYEYENEDEAVSKNLGASGLQKSFRIKSRRDKIGETIYNEKKYTYSPNNNSGYPAHSDPSNLPTSFTYYTTVTTPHTSLSETHTFSNKHLTTKVETKHGAKKIQDKSYEYNNDKLPTKITTKTYDYTNDSNFMQSIEMMAYDGKGNVITSWTPLAGGRTSDTEHKTDYTYDNAYNQMTSVNYKQGASTTVTKAYTLDSLGRHPVLETIVVDDVAESMTAWEHDDFGNVVSENCYKGSDFVSIAAGSYNCLAVRSTGTVWEETSSNGLSDVDAVAAGWFHSLALKNDGTVWAWGVNSGGELGDGSTDQRDVPVQVSGLSSVVGIAAGDLHSLALKNDGTVWAWGRNTEGQLGDGSLTRRTTPVQVRGLSGVVDISAGSDHSFALKSDGTVWVWGSNQYGQLGNGGSGSTIRTMPIQVNGLSGIVGITAGDYYNLALKNDGTLWAWGSNSSGQLGDGTTTQRTSPVQVSGLSGVISVAAGRHHSLALKSNGTVWGWGDVRYGKSVDVTIPMQLKALSSESVRTEYTYQNNAYLSSVKTSGVLASDGSPAEGTPGYAAGTVVTNYTYDNLGRMTKMTDPRGYETSYEYNAKNDLIKVINPDSTMRQYARSYTQNYIASTDEKGTQLKTTYTKLGQQYETIDLASNTVLSRKTYDVLGRLATDTDLINNNTTTYTYDHLSRVTDIKVTQGTAVLSQERYAYAVTSDGLRKTTKTQVGDAKAASVVTSSYVNNMGFEVKTGKGSGANEKTDAFVYDYVGNMTQLTSASGKVSKWEHDFAGRVTKETNALNQSTLFVYDALGNNVSSTDFAGNTSNYTYDTLGRLLSQTAPFGGAYNSVKTFDYDPSGNVIRERVQNNAPGQAERFSKTEYIYSSRGFLAAKAGYDGSNVADGVTFTHDAVGNVLTRTAGAQGYNPAVTTNTYDRFGNVLTVTDPLNNTETSTYDLAGNLLTKTDRGGAVTTYTYDGLGRVLTQSNSVGQCASYSYTLTGQLRQEKTKIDSSRWQTVDYAYNDRGLMSKKATYAEKQDIEGYNDYQFDYQVIYMYVEVYGGEQRRTVFYTNGMPVYWDDWSPNLPNTIQYNEGGYSGILNIVRVSDPSPIVYLNGNCIEQRHIYYGGLVHGMFPISNHTPLELSTTYAYDLDGNLTALTGPDSVTTKYTYDALNRQLSQSRPGKNENGQTVTVTSSQTYNTLGQIASKTDALGNVTQYAYNPQGLPTHETAPDGGVTVMEYDLAGRLIKAVSPQNNLTGCTTYSVTKYDDLDRKVATQEYVSGELYSETKCAYDAHGRLMSSTDALGNTTSFAYDSCGRLLHTTDPLWNTTSATYDALGRVLTETDAEGTVTSYTYDQAGRMLTKTVSGALVQTNTYDLAGNVLTAKNANSATVTSTYTLWGAVRSTTLPGDSNIASLTTTNKFDVSGNLIRQTDSMGREAFFTYDSMSRVLTETSRKSDDSQSITTSRAYDVGGNVIFETDGNGGTTTYAYDNMGRVSSVTNTLNQSSTYTYDLNGNNLTSADRLGNTFVYEYDTLNRLIKSYDPAGEVVERLEYDKMHRQVKSTDALDNLTQFTYDALGRQLSVIDPRGYHTSTAYDRVGRAKSQTDGNGNTTEFAYDARGNLINVNASDDTVTSYTYDNMGNLLTQTDGSGNVTETRYNIRGLASARIDQSGQSETYSYTADGSLSERIDRNGVTTTYTYDIHGRLLCENSGGEPVSYTYDANSNQLTMTDSTGTTTRAYDALGRVVSKDVPGFGVTSFSYDIAAGGGKWSETTTDPQGNVTRKTYDEAGRLYQVYDGSGTTTYAYYANGSLQSVSYPGGTVESYEYYPNGKLWKLTNKRGDLILDAYQYAYDAAGNMTYKADVKGITSYTYDGQNRLLTVTEPDGKTTGYTYDGAGNRLTETVTDAGGTVTVTECTYDERNRLTETSKESGGDILVTTYHYDDNGNMLSKMPELFHALKAGAAEGLSFEWEQDELEPAVYRYDNRNQMISAHTAEGEYTYTYNGAGLRVSKTSGEEAVQFLYEYDKIVLEKETKGTSVTYTRNVYGINLISRDEDGAKAYYLYNGHHDVVQLVTESGILVASYYYDAFGVIMDETGDGGNPYRYAGYYFDTETTLYYLKSRFYDAGIARFLQEDTYYGSQADPLSLNLYAYCANNPICYYDPSGHYISPTDRNILTDKELIELGKAGDAWNNATTDAERRAAHAWAEKIRNDAGYSGGADGNSVSFIFSRDTGLPAPLQALIIMNQETYYHHSDNMSVVSVLARSGADIRKSYYDMKFTESAQYNEYNNPIAAEAGKTTANIITRFLETLSDFGSVSADQWAVIKAENALETWSEYTSAGGVKEYAYHGAFGHSTVTASISSERGSWYASTSAHLELSYNEALFVHNVMSADNNHLGVQLTLGKALNVLNAGNAEYYVNGWDGLSNILSYDAMKRIISPGFVELDDATKHGGILGSYTDYELYVNYVNQEYFSSISRGMSVNEYINDVQFQNNMLGLGAFAFGMSALSLYKATANSGTYTFSPNSRLDMIEYNLYKNGYVPYSSMSAWSSAERGWSMSKGGATINGRFYSEHALERMAPNTPEVRAELNTRAAERAAAAGFKPGTKEYNSFVRGQIDPRGVPPMVVEDAIRQTTAVPGLNPGTFVHQTSDINVIVNSTGGVITVIPK